MRITITDDKDHVLAFSEPLSDESILDARREGHKTVARIAGDIEQKMEDDLVQAVDLLLKKMST